VIQRIHIERLQVQAHVGVPAEERVERQRLTLNVSFWPRLDHLYDELADTVNYSAVAKVVREVVSRRQYKLIETFAEEVAAELVRQFAMRKVEIEVRKFVLADAEYVSVTAVREAESEASASVRPQSP
jgi:7,8-dihydroneopterin aldolase/epimerase/oxygenase